MLLRSVLLALVDGELQLTPEDTPAIAVLGKDIDPSIEGEVMELGLGLPTSPPPLASCVREKTTITC